MGRIYASLGLSAKPRWNNDREPMGGDNECFTLKHDNPHGKLLDIKYRVGAKEYKVAYAPYFPHQHESPTSNYS
jgi:hypothetical protein